MSDLAKINLHLGPQLGEGCSGVVYPIVSAEGGRNVITKEIYIDRCGDASKLDDNTFALESLVAKEVKLDEGIRDNLLKEVELLKMCSEQCRGVVRYAFSGTTVGDCPSLVVVMGACRGELWAALTSYKSSRTSTPKSGASLKPGLSRQGSGLSRSNSNSGTIKAGLVSGLPSMDERISWTKSLCESICDCHGLGILHRDLNPWNLLISAEKAQDGSRNICLTDFGLAVRIKDQAELCGLESEGAVPLDDSALSSLYSAPELGKTYGLSADVFSAGMVLLAVWSTVDVSNEEALVDCVQAVKQSAVDGVGPPDDILQSIQEGVDSEVRTLIMSMVSAQPHMRPSALQACRQVEDWLAKRAREATLDTIADAKVKGGVCAKLCKCLFSKATAK